MSDLYSVKCTNCGAVRSEDLKAKCPKCNSRQSWLLGYVYEHEARSFLITLTIIGGVIVLFLTMGCLYVYYVKIILGV